MLFIIRLFVSYVGFVASDVMIIVNNQLESICKEIFMACL